MSKHLRRLLNHLPLPHGNGELYIRSSWHKPTPFDQWISRPPFRSSLAANHFGRGLRRRRLVGYLVRGSLTLAVSWVIIESIRALT
jgi:hypothetical protein